jgi:hypothetical protein
LTPLPQTTITIPGATVTVSQPNPLPTKLPVPNNLVATKSIKVPGSTKTQVKTEVKVPLAPSPRIPVGQPPAPSATMETPTSSPKTRIETRTKTETIVKRVLLGTLLSIMFFVVGASGLFIGYYLGGRDAYRKDDKFLKGLLDRATYRKQH